MPLPAFIRPLKSARPHHCQTWLLTAALAFWLLPATATAHQQPPAVAGPLPFAPAVEPAVSTTQDDFSDADFAQADQPELGDRTGGVTFILELITGFAFAFISTFLIGLVLGALFLLCLFLWYAAEWVIDRFRSASATPESFPQPTE